MNASAKILIVEDQDVIRQSTRRVLEAAGYLTFEAIDGEQALEIARSHRPDLMLLDVNLPKMDGFEVLRRIKADPTLVSVYVVIVSGSRVDATSRVQGLETGADGYLTRPISSRELLAHVQSLLRLKAAEEAVRAYSEKLEDMVAARTKELQTAQEKLIRQERLALLGQLSGSIAHELRTPLGAIKNAVYLLTMILETPDAQAHEALDILAQQIKISEQIINNLLDFARSRQIEKQSVDVNRVLDQTLRRLNVPAGIDVRQDLADLPPVSADPGQLGQILGNLLLNAIQAMPDGGQLTLRTYLSSPERVAIAVADTGVGISPENRERLFEPLFTTKSKGIGLGLALVKMLVEAHNGNIQVASTVGQGSTFTVELPVQR